MKPNPTITCLLAALTVAAIAVPTASAAPSTGTWSGTMEQDLGLDEPYTTSIVVKAYRGRVIGLVAQVRMECDDDSILDAKAVKSYRVGRGPKLSRDGAFSLKVKSNRHYSTASGHIRLAGTLGRRGGEGRASAEAEGCRGNGTWEAERVT